MSYKAIAIFVLLAYFGTTNACRKPLKIEFDELKESIADGSAFLIDIRHPEVVERDGKIPNSIHVFFGAMGHYDPDFCVDIECVSSNISKAFNLTNEEFKEKYGRDYPYEKNIVIYGSMDTIESPYIALIIANTDLFRNNSIRYYYDGFNDWKINGGEIVPSVGDGYPRENSLSASASFKNGDAVKTSCHRIDLCNELCTTSIPLPPDLFEECVRMCCEI